MNLQTTRVFEQNALAYSRKKTLLINQGGTSSSKTYSILQLLIIIAVYAKVPTMISVVSESLPHLKRGAMRDYQVIMGEDFRADAWAATDKIYTFGRGKIEFFGADDASKLRGGRRDILFINEANNISRDAFDELDVRTRACTIIDYNPVSEFWAHDLMASPENLWKNRIHFNKSTYLDAKHVLPPETVAKIESRRGDPNWWHVYGLGEVGNIEGLVHPSFSVVDEMPSGGIEFYGLDYGYSQDPTALVRNVILGQDLYSDQLIYESGLMNDQIAKRFEQVGVRKNYDEIFADAAEPKSAAEIRRYGYNIRGAPKGEDSVRTGIQLVNQYKQHWTKRSVDCIKEQRNYRYIETADGKITEKPMDDFNHGMDARRYALAGKIQYGSVVARKAYI